MKDSKEPSGLEHLGLPKVIADRVTALARSGDTEKAKGVLIGFGSVVTNDEFKAAALIEYFALVEMERNLDTNWALLILDKPEDVTTEELNLFYAEGRRRLEARHAATLQKAGAKSFDELVEIFTGVDNGTTH